MTRLHLPANISTVLIIRSGALGDLIYSTAVIDALRRQYGEAIRIDFVSTPGAGALFSQDPRVRRVYPLKNRNLPLWISPEKRKIVSVSKREAYDLLINLEWGKQFYDLAKAVRATHKVGMPFGRPTVPPASAHAADHVKAFCAQIIRPDILASSVPRLYGSDVHAIRQRYGLPDRYVVINASNSHIKKQRINYRAWPQPHWKRLLALLDATVVQVLIANKHEEEYFEQIRPFPPHAIDLTGKTPLPDLIAVIAHAQAVITTDTGPAHMAAAVNTPVFVLIGPTPEQETGPYPTPENEVHILKAGLACQPCYRTPVMDACRDNICMQQISPEHVASEVTRRLKRS